MFKCVTNDYTSHEFKTPNDLKEFLGTIKDYSLKNGAIRGIWSDEADGQKLIVAALYRGDYGYESRVYNNLSQDDGNRYRPHFSTYEVSPVAIDYLDIASMFIKINIERDIDKMVASEIDSIKENVADIQAMFRM